MIGIMDDHKCPRIDAFGGGRARASLILFWLTFPPVVPDYQIAVPFESFKTKFLSAWNYK